MSNFPTLSKEAEAMLLHVLSYEYQARGPRLDNNPARRELKKHKLIYSRPINANILLPAAAGGGYQWRPTEFGVEIGEALRQELDEARVFAIAYHHEDPEAQPAPTTHPSFSWAQQMVRRAGREFPSMVLKARHLDNGRYAVEAFDKETGQSVGLLREETSHAQG